MEATLEEIRDAAKAERVRCYADLEEYIAKCAEIAPTMAQARDQARAMREQFPGTVEAGQATIGVQNLEAKFVEWGTEINAKIVSMLNLYCLAGICPEAFTLQDDGTLTLKPEAIDDGGR